MMATKKKRVYLDYNATTPLEPEVLDSIQDALQNAWGNPSSSHDAGQEAKEVIRVSRSAVAQMVGGQANDIIFTSGGTEANNMLFHSVIQHFHETYPAANTRYKSHNGLDGQSAVPHVITSNLEHDSVALALQNLSETGKAEVTMVPASKRTGCVDVNDIIPYIRPTTCLVTIMLANNEIGTIQPIAEIVERIRSLSRNPNTETSKIFVHTDAAQAIGKVKVDVDELGVDYLTIVGHKFYGPRIGALYVRGCGGATGTPLYPMFYGGGQERGFRPGTENTGMIAGLGKAAELVVKNLAQYEAHMREIRDYMEEKLKEAFKDEVIFNSHFQESKILPNTCNVSFKGDGLQGHRVLGAARALQASVGAACHKQNKPSHILLNVGIPVEVASNAIRLSVGRETTKLQIDRVVSDLHTTVTRLQKGEEASTEEEKEIKSLLDLDVDIVPKFKQQTLHLSRNLKVTINGQDMQVVSTNVNLEEDSNEQIAFVTNKNSFITYSGKSTVTVVEPALPRLELF